MFSRTGCTFWFLFVLVPDSRNSCRDPARCQFVARVFCSSHGHTEFVCRCHDGAMHDPLFRQWAEQITLRLEGKK